MNSTKSETTAVRPTLVKGTAIAVVVCLLSILVFAFRDTWLPRAREWVSVTNQVDVGVGADPAVANPRHANSLELSPQARKNIGLRMTQVELKPFVKTVSMPALVVERPGRSQVEVTAPLGGRVTRVYPVQGQAVMPGEPLFDLRLTHEELVNAQVELLRSVEEVDVVEREIKRLESVSIAGAIPGKTKRQREYEQQKLEAVINSQTQSLELHGLTPDQVKDIVTTRRLLQGITVVAPPHLEEGHEDDDDHPFHIQELTVKPGQYVDAGSRLTVLADHHELFIEGRAFEQDIEELHRLANERWTVSATADAGGQIDGLEIFYLSDVVETESRAFHFYLRLPNEIVRDITNEAGHRFVSWKFKPGQRMQILVPVERWVDCIVLPVDAVAQDGVETFVFEQNGNHFDRVAVHVKHRDERWVVVESDARLIGGTLATNGAQQLQMALKNRAGGGVDPHAGHNH